MGKSGESSNLISSLESRVKQSFSLDKLLCYFSIPVKSHVSKKNGRPIFRNRGTGIPFLGKDANLRAAEESMIIEFKMQRIAQGIMDPISERVWMIYHFYFRPEDYFTKKGEISLKLPDLSNLLELPSDCLQKAHIILNDTQIESFDLSRRLMGPEAKLDVFILKYDSKTL